MVVDRIDDGLWRWVVTHPAWEPGQDWDEAVGCVYWEGPEEIVLVDPLVPGSRADRERFFDSLDRDVARVRAPVVALTTCSWHARSAVELAARYGGRVFGPLSTESGLPSGVTAIDVPVAAESMYWLEGARALVPGDAIIGGAEGGVRMCPPSWLDSGGSSETLRAELTPVLDLPVERVLVSHGAPLLWAGLEGLRVALAP